MYYVDVYRRNDRGQYLAGRITFDGHQLRAEALDPNSVNMLNIVMNEDVFAQNQLFNPRVDPLGWLTNLHFKFRGGYASVSQLKQA